MDRTKEETISAWIYQHQKPLTIPFLDQEKRLNRKITDSQRTGYAPSALSPDLRSSAHRLPSYREQAARSLF